MGVHTQVRWSFGPHPRRQTVSPKGFTWPEGNCRRVSAGPARLVPGFEPEALDRHSVLKVSPGRKASVEE